MVAGSSPAGDTIFFVAVVVDDHGYLPCSSSLVVMTSALHAEGRGFNPHLEYSFGFTAGRNKNRTTATGFEPARAKPIGFQNQLLNHSDTLSVQQCVLSISVLYKCVCVCVCVCVCENGKSSGGPGYRSLCLVDANHALYHLS